MLDLFPKRIVASLGDQIPVDLDADASHSVFFRRPYDNRAVAAADVVNDVAGLDLC